VTQEGRACVGACLFLTYLYSYLHQLTPLPVAAPVQAVDMHRTFQRDLVRLRLTTARAYVRALTDGEVRCCFCCYC
jgi:hypothetical protein